MRNIIYAVFMILLGFSACTNRQKNQDSAQDSLAAELNTGPESFPADSSLESTSEKVLSLIKNKQYDSLALFFHPSKGVRFSPYAFIDTKADVQLSAEAFLNALNSGKQLHWGSFDGSGEAIDLSIEEYFKRFVYDADFLNAEQRHSNRSVAKGNSLDNQPEVYPDLPYTESYFPGFEEKYQGMDWRALRLVFEKKDKRYFLVAVIHDEWTI